MHVRDLAESIGESCSDVELPSDPDSDDDGSLRGELMDCCVFNIVPEWLVVCSEALGNAGKCFRCRMVGRGGERA